MGRCSKCGIAHSQPDACKAWLDSIAQGMSHERVRSRWDALARLAHKR